MSFPARFANKCANGHQIEVDDYIAINEYGQVLCTKCDEFTTGRKTKETLYSNLMCTGCFIELSLAEKEQGKVKCADCDQ